MKPEQQKNLLYILVPSTILVILWILFSVYNKSVTTTISSTQTQEIKSISPIFQSAVLSNLGKRQSIEPIFSIESVPTDEGTDSGSLSLTPSPASSSAGQTTDATNSGGIKEL